MPPKLSLAFLIWRRFGSAVLALLPYSPKAHGTQLKKGNPERDNPVPFKSKLKNRRKKWRTDSESIPFGRILIVVNGSDNVNYINTPVQIQITNCSLKVRK